MIVVDCLLAGVEFITGQRVWPKRLVYMKYLTNKRPGKFPTLLLLILIFLQMFEQMIKKGTKLWKLIKIVLVLDWDLNFLHLRSDVVYNFTAGMHNVSVKLYRCGGTDDPSLQASK